MDDVDDFVFATSASGDEDVVGPDQPSFFVLKVNRLPRSFPIVNDLLAVSPVSTSCCADSRFTIEATFTNQSTQTIVAPVFEVSEITGGNLLENADGAPTGVGAVLTPRSNGGFVGSLRPGESMTVTFDISLATRNPFRFLVNGRGFPRP